MKEETASDISTVFGVVAMIGLIGLIIAFFIYAVPVLVDVFGGFFYWLVVSLPWWFMNKASLAQQVALVSVLLLILGLTLGLAFMTYPIDDPDPDGPL